MKNLYKTNQLTKIKVEILEKFKLISTSILTETLKQELKSSSGKKRNSDDNKGKGVVIDVTDD